MENFELKYNKFKAIKITGEESQFSELKHTCGSDITISYETCEVGDYWNISLYDCLKETEVVVPNHSYILQLNEGFTVVDNIDMEAYFNKVTDNK